MSTYYWYLTFVIYSHHANGERGRKEGRKREKEEREREREIGSSSLKAAIECY